MSNNDDELASFLFPIERKPAKEKLVDVFALMTGVNKPAEQLDNTIELKTSIEPERKQEQEESKSIVEVPNIPVAIANTIAEKKQRTPRLHYAHGKQLVAMEQSEFIERFKKANLRTEYAAFILAPDYVGCRASEMYELTVDKFHLTEDAIEIEIFRKKHSAQTPNISLKRNWFGVNTIVSWYLTRVEAKPSVKSVYIFDIKLNPSSQVLKKKTIWMFPNISRSTSLKIAKAVYGQEKYCHYARLNRLTRLGSNPEASIVLLKSFSGIRSTSILERYLGVSQKQLDKAISLIGADGAIPKEQ